MKKVITKNQHYVPQMILRNFAWKQKKEMKSNVYVIESDNIRKNQNIKKIFSQNYMYDRDNLVEDFLSKNVESPACSEISEIISDPLNIKKTANIDLLRFMSVQLYRTQEAYNQGQKFINYFFGTVFQETARLNNLDEEAAKKINITPNEPSSFKARQTVNAALSWPLISNLSHHILINDTVGSEFIISDHPIFQYNWYLRDSVDTASTSLANKGLQLFFPITPKIMYCLYDSSVYCYGTAKFHYTYVNKKSDLDILNSFQMLNADSGIAFKSIEMQYNITKLASKFAKLSTFINHSAHNKAVEVGNGKLKSTHAVWRTQTKISTMPSFIKVKNKIRRKKVVCIERDPRIVQAVYYALKYAK